MAISAPHYRLFKSLKPILPHGGTLLEIGEANWYGDLDPQEIVGPDYCFGTELIGKLSAEKNLFAIAKAFYTVTFAPSKIVSIDKHGTPEALKLDLNQSTGCAIGNYDICINHGTAEHIFNIAQVFRTMHDHCIDGGLMIHDAPFHGQLDHGFYCLQPTLFYDLAAVNCYEIVMAAIYVIESQQIIRLEGREHVSSLIERGEVPDKSYLFVVYRKRSDGPFKIPMQGYYARTLGDSGNRAWEAMR